MSRIRTALVAFALVSAACGGTSSPSALPPPPPPVPPPAPVVAAPVADAGAPYAVPKNAKAFFVGEGIVCVRDASGSTLLDGNTGRVLTKLGKTDYPHAAGGVVFAFSHPGVVVARPYAAEPRPVQLDVAGLHRIDFDDHVFEVAIDTASAKLGIVPLEGDHLGAVVPLEGTTSAKVETATSREHLLAVLQKDEVLLFALPSGRAAGRIPAPNAPQSNIAFSPDGKWLYLDDSKRGMLVDVAQRKVARAFDAAFHHGEFSPNGKLFANPTKDFVAVEVLSLPDLKRVRRFVLARPTCKDVGCPPDQRPAMDAAGELSTALDDEGHYEELLSIPYDQPTPEGVDNVDAIVLRRDGVVRRIEPEAPRGTEAVLLTKQRRVIVDGEALRIHVLDGSTPPVEVPDAHLFSLGADETRLLVRSRSGGIRMLAWSGGTPAELWRLEPASE